MIDIRDFPFKGKRVTNTYIQALLCSVAWCVWLGMLAVCPVPTVASSIGFLIFLLGRSIYRDILPEWRT